MKRIIDNIKESISSYTKNSKTKLSKAQREEAYKLVLETINDSPRIAVIGKTGVGKSSTINALFKPKQPLEVGHVVATTKKFGEITVSLDENRGSIILIDCPGLNESIAKDRVLIPKYKKLLKSCDVALWITKATDKALAEDQRLLVSLGIHDIQSRLIVGINQVDVIQPGRWIQEFNVPSREQERSIKLKIKDVRSKLKEISVDPVDIITYSAQEEYRLPSLFRAMIDATPLPRAAVLGAKESVWPTIRVNN